MSVHIRQGDTRPQDQRYHQKAMPVSVYARGLNRAIDTFVPQSSTLPSKVKVWVGSDSARALDEFETVGCDGTVGEGCDKWEVYSLRRSERPEVREMVYPLVDGYFQSDWNAELELFDASVAEASSIGAIGHGNGLIGAAHAEGVASDKRDGSGGEMWTDEEKVRYTSGMIVDLALLSGLWDGRYGEEAGSGNGIDAMICGIRYVQLRSFLFSCWEQRY